MAAKKKDQLNEAAKAAAASAERIVIKPPEYFTLAFELKGKSDLIQNNFSQKSIEQMLKKHMGISVTRETKKPREVIEQAKILNTKGQICLSTVAFKSAMVAAAATVKSLKKTQLRIGLFVEGNSVPIKYERMEPRMDIVRVGGASKVPDVRFRPSFINWSARIVVSFSDLYNPVSIVDLLQRAGTVGVGEWRPEKNGTFGTFTIERHIEDKKEIAEINELCATPLVRPVIPDWALDMDIDPDALSKLANAMGNVKTEGDEEAGENLDPTPEQQAELENLKEDYKRSNGAGASV